MRKPRHIPRPDEEPDFDERPQRGYNELAWFVEYRLNEERKHNGGYHDERKPRPIA